VAPLVVRLEDLIGGLASVKRDEDDGLLISFCPHPVRGPVQARKFWGLVLLLSVRDRATSVHFHSWRIDATLAYIVDNVWHEMVPPPTEYTGEIIGAARALFTAPRRSGLFSRLAGRSADQPACAPVSLDVYGVPIVWDVVCWSSGERSGVELFRITPLEAPPPGRSSADGS
jgi:hypothetical protein